LQQFEAAMSAKLEIKRKASWFAAARGAHVTIDQQEAAYIANGKMATIDVPAGTHTVAVRLGMTSGRPSNLTFEEGKVLRLNCRLKMGVSTTEFVLFHEDGTPLQGNAGPAGHHGPLILIFGIVGFFIGLLGLAAVIQGVIDLLKMSKGEVDPSGRTLTLVGAVLGGIGFSLNLGLLIAWFAYQGLGN
jgi:hypothetical protein